MSESTGCFTNGLTQAEFERLAVLLEEMGEAQQCIGKILRHGYESRNPMCSESMTNRHELTIELGDVRCAIQMLIEAGDVSATNINARMWEKAEKIKRYLHHQEAAHV